MKSRMNRLVCAGVTFAMLWGVSAYAAYQDITIMDTVGTGTGWYTLTSENQEVEPGCVTGQAWDMEMFLLDKTSSSLQLKGGFDMKNGYGGYYAGDVFIDVNGDALWGNNTPVGTPGSGWDIVNNSLYKWDYVISFGRTGTSQGGSSLNGNYSVYNLMIGNPSDVEVYYDQNYRSNPFRYVSGGLLVASGTGLTQTSSTDSEGTHYVWGNISLGFLAGNLGASDVTFHFTEGCGNDLLMGQTPSWSIPDGGFTVALLGLSLSAMGFAASRLPRMR